MKPVSKTAFYCCAVRAWDAESEAPLLGDQYARLFMTDEARALMEPYRRLRDPNRSNVVRHRIVEDILRQQLAARPDRLVVVIGAGFDATAFRLDGGRYVEIDEPQIFALKDPKLPAASSRNPLTRVAIDFETESLEDKLAPWRNEPDVTVVVEGVLVYLTHGQRKALLDTLEATFPQHSLVCDVFSETFIRRYGRGLRERLASMGAHFGDLLDDPAGYFAGRGYRVEASIPIVLTAAKLGATSVPVWLLRTLLRSLGEGYRIWHLEKTPRPRD